MASDSDKARDPVCGKIVPPDQNAIVYQGMHFEEAEVENLEVRRGFHMHGAHRHV